MQITPEMVEAWRTLQAYARTIHPFDDPSKEAVRLAIDTLDNSDFMVPIEDEGHGLESAPAICNCGEPGVSPCIVTGHQQV